MRTGIATSKNRMWPFQIDLISTSPQGGLCHEFFRFPQIYVDRGEVNGARQAYLHAMEKRVTHRASALPALCRILCKGAIDDFAHWLRDVLRALSKRYCGLFEDGSDGVVDTTALAQVERKRTC